MSSRKELQDNEFKLTLSLEKARAEYMEENGELILDKNGDPVIKDMWVGGRASGVNLDRDHERMAKSAIEAFKKAIDEGMTLPDGSHSLIPLRNEHGKGWHDVLGWIVKAEIDESHDLWIEAKLNKNHSVARDLYSNLHTPEEPSKPVRLGFSVGGFITKASMEWDAELGKRVRVIENVRLREVSVVGQPANPTAFVEALAKSLNLDALDGENNMSELHKDLDLTKFATKEEIETLVKSEDLDKFLTKEDFAEFTTKFETLSNALDAVIVKIEEASNSKQEEDVSKSENADTGEGTMEKQFADLLDAFNGFKDNIVSKDTVATLVEEVQGLRKEVKELGDREMDNSISVNKAKSEDDESPLAKYRAARAAETRRLDPIEDAVKFGLLVKNSSQE